jgi:hypothetical protein
MWLMFRMEVKFKSDSIRKERSWAAKKCRLKNKWMVVFFQILEKRTTHNRRFVTPCKIRSDEIDGD